MIFDIVTHQNKNGVFDNITIINQETGEVVDLAHFLSLNGQIFVNNLNYAFMLIVKMCIKCGFKNTSCPDQLSCALQEYLSNKQ